MEPESPISYSRDMLELEHLFPYHFNNDYSTSVAYFSMEYAIDQSLKIYSGGLGFLSGSHLRSAYELRQNFIGIGLLWKYGYYDQQWNNRAEMEVAYVEKHYSFLEDTGIIFTILIDNSPVHIKVWLLRPETFGTAPLFLLSTDIVENDHLARSITRNLYSSNELTRIAQSIVLGIGGARLLDILNRPTEVYHMNEGHALPLCFYLYSKLKNKDKVKNKVAFTTHTPEAAGNEIHRLSLLKQMNFFHDVPDEDLSNLNIVEHSLNYTLTALRFSGKANAVSKIHGNVARSMWTSYSDICEITHITNAQNKLYWADKELDQHLSSATEVSGVIRRKKELKTHLFKTVADQTGKLFDKDILTLVWARRFATYKRADLLLKNWERFLHLINNKQYPIQIIWAGKPYPEDQNAVGFFNQILNQVRSFKNCAVLIKYELALSGELKKGSDVWLNTPIPYREASGTSGMSAAMNGSLNVSIPDGWIPEFGRHLENCFLIQTAHDHINQTEKDLQECNQLLELLETTILPMYYENQQEWVNMMKTAARDVSELFDSSRLAHMYYQQMYVPVASEPA